MTTSSTRWDAGWPATGWTTTGCAAGSVEPRSSQATRPCRPRRMRATMVPASMRAMEVLGVARSRLAAVAASAVVVIGLLGVPLALGGGARPAFAEAAPPAPAPANSVTAHGAAAPDLGAAGGMVLAEPL